jgi:cobalamin biosynthesis Mg chelatase CobN
MDLFGYSPMTDQLILVRCNHCTKTVKASRFNAHLGHCLKAMEPAETKAIEEKVNGKRKTAPVAEAKKVKEEPIAESSDINTSSRTSISTKGGVTSKTTIIIPTSSSSTSESPSKKKKTSKSNKKEEKKKKKSKKEKKGKTTIFLEIL